ncbi:MAG: hypothetical protein K8M05_23570 [Deltaproteobacteria bacterium]|nr:hypothetical protein [Kofleriaceae bacterium]
MSGRRRISIAVAGTGIVLALVALVARDRLDRALVEPPVSARSGAIEVAMADRFLAPGDNLALRVTDHSGDAVRIHAVSVRWPGWTAEPHTFVNDAPVRAYVRGASARIVVRPPLEDWAGGMPLEVHVEHSADLGAGGMRHGTSIVGIDVPRHGGAERARANALLAARSWGLLLLGLLVVVVVARRFAAAPGSPPDARDTAALLVGLAGFAIVGEVLFARPFLAGFQRDAPGLRALLIALWVGLPLLWLLVQRYRRPAREPWVPGARLRARTR